MPVPISEYKIGVTTECFKIPKEFITYQAAANILELHVQSIKRVVDCGYVEVHPDFKDFLLNKLSLETYKEKKTNEKLARKQRQEQEVQIQECLKSQYAIISEYGTSTKEIDLIHLKTTEEETRAILSACNYILKHRKTKYVYLLQSKALARKEQLEKMQKTDYEMSIAGYKFDF